MRAVSASCLASFSAFLAALADVAFCSEFTATFWVATVVGGGGGGVTLGGE